MSTLYPSSQNSCRRSVPQIMDYDYEPMDVDLSGNSIHHVDAMDISYTDNRASPVIKIKKEPLEVSKPVEENDFDSDIQIVTPVPITKRFTIKISHRRGHKIWSNMALSVIFTVLSLISLLTYHILKFECSGDLKLDVLKTSLAKNVIGQPHAIENIIKSLEEPMQSPYSSKLLLFYGGTGVGKTLTISLILENLHQYANVYHYTMPSFIDTVSTDLMLGLTFCPTTIIIVDDLNSTDMHVTEHLKKIIEKGEHLGKNITIILVFNCDIINENYIKRCDDSFSLELQQAFKEIKALKRHIKFNLLTEEHLRRCIKKEMGTRTLSEVEYKNIVKHFNVSVDGCKGVYTKIKLLNFN